MKRVVYFLLGLFIIVSFQCKKDKPINREGIVNFLTGKVYIISEAKKSAAKIGDVIKQGMKIETGANSTVDIYFDQNVIKILENSTIEISELVIDIKNNAEKTNLYIEKGGLFSKVVKKLSKDDDFRIKTPTAIAAVRGTDFLVSEDNGKGKIACLDGKVLVENAKSPEIKSVELNKDEEVVVEEGKQMTVKSLSMENKQRIQDILKNIKELQADIRKRFEEQREEIRKAVADQKKKNREMIDERKAKDKENVERQKAEDKERIDAIKGGVDIEGAKGSTNKEKDAAKDLTDKQKEESKGLLKGVKPEIKKFKSEVE